MHRRSLHHLAAALIAVAFSLLLGDATFASSPVPIGTHPAGPASIGTPASPTRGHPAPSVAAATSGADLCAQVGAAAGFPRSGVLVTAVAVSLAESSCTPSASGTNGPTAGCPNGSIDRGLWQINNCYHSEVNDSCAYNAQCNANAAYQISSGGTNWSPWSTYNSGAYRSYLSQAQTAVNRLATSASGTVVASPSVNVRPGPGSGTGLAGHANYGDLVTINCWVYGDYVSQGYWPSSIWDSIFDSTTGAAGYAADTWIQTSTDIRNLAPSC